MSRQVGGDGTVGKALEVLDMVASFEKPVRFSDLLEQSTYPKATLYRFLQVLANQGMLYHDPDHGTYSLGMRLMRLAHSAWNNASLAAIAKDCVDELARESGETVHLAQIDDGHVLFVDKKKASDRIETLAKVGVVAPAYCTGVGKAMLAFMAPKRLEIVLQQQSYFQYTQNSHRSAESVLEELQQIRAAGFAFDREEHEDGIISIAAPILATSGRVVGAISIATSTTRHSLATLEQFKPALLQAARKIGEDATSWQFPA